MAVNSNWGLMYEKNFLDVSNFIEDPPKERKFIKYVDNKIIEYGQGDVEYGSVSNCSSRYNYPKYKSLYYECKSKVEKIIGEKLYPTYYYDRFYFRGSDLKPHIDRPSCEISVSLNISTNLEYDWPLFFKVGEDIHGIPTDSGDAIIYKGMNIEHWRQTLVGSKKSYYHQVFFHFVRADGHYLEYAYDRL